MRRFIQYQRLEQALQAALVLGDSIYLTYPWAISTSLPSESVEDLLLNNT